MNLLADNYGYWLSFIVMTIGLYGVLMKNNLIKKVIGLSIFQSSIILFFIISAYKTEAVIPVMLQEDLKAGHESGEFHGHGHSPKHSGQQGSSPQKGGHTHAKVPLHESIDPNRYINPLPHALMLTAIVVGVATVGVAFSLIICIFREYNTLEEDEILKKLDS